MFCNFLFQDGVIEKRHYFPLPRQEERYPPFCLHFLGSNFAVWSSNLAGLEGKDGTLFGFYGINPQDGAALYKEIRTPAAFERAGERVRRFLDVNCLKA